VLGGQDHLDIKLDMKQLKKTLKIKNNYISSLKKKWEGGKRQK
jgi:hypothetical protein